jgi:hypothetical protein
LVTCLYVGSTHGAVALDVDDDAADQVLRSAASAEMTPHQFPKRVQATLVVS